jgi:hypothetical protein
VLPHSNGASGCDTRAARDSQSFCKHSLSMASPARWETIVLSEMQREHHADGGRIEGKDMI